MFSTNVNRYSVLLGNLRIPSVPTLAASLGVEAQALGLPTQFVLGHPGDRFCGCGPAAAGSAGPRCAGRWVLDRTHCPSRHGASGAPTLAAPGALQAWRWPAAQQLRQLSRSAAEQTFPAGPKPHIAAGGARPAAGSGAGLGPSNRRRHAAESRRRQAHSCPALQRHPTATRRHAVLAEGFHSVEDWGCWRSQTRPFARCAVSSGGGRGRAAAGQPHAQPLLRVAAALTGGTRVQRRESVWPTPSSASGTRAHKTWKSSCR